VNADTAQKVAWSGRDYAVSDGKRFRVIADLLNSTDRE
jgi:hypothetical protein